MTKKEALAKELEIVEEDLEEIRPDTFEDINTGHEYWVLTDDEADQEFYESEKSLVEDLKGKAFSDPYWIIKHIKRDVFDDVVNEINENYVNDLSDEEVIDEAEDHDIISEEEAKALRDTLNPLDLDELRDGLIDELSDVGDSVDWYIDAFGEKDAIDTAFTIDAIDYDGLIEDIEFNDGRGPALANWDGIENWICGTDYYYYRQN